MMLKIRFDRFDNTFRKNMVARRNFLCARFDLSWSAHGDFLNEALRDGGALQDEVNPNKANGKTARTKQVVGVDCLSGMLAERLALHLLNHAFGEPIASRPKASSSKNQIDILSSSLGQKRTMEVRSSFPRNGAAFALFNTDKNGVQYFDVLGPYHNTEYKPEDECMKDYFLRVLFPVDKRDVAAYFRRDHFTAYLTGGATRAMMEDPALYRLKTLAPEDMLGEADPDEQPALYRVIPLADSLDIRQFLTVFGAENGLTLTPLCAQRMEEAMAREADK